MAAKVDPFGDHVSFMKGLYMEYQKQDDFENIAYVEQLMSDCQRMVSQRESVVKDIIRGV